MWQRVYLLLSSQFGQPSSHRLSSPSVLSWLLPPSACRVRHAHTAPRRGGWAPLLASVAHGGTVSFPISFSDSGTMLGAIPHRILRIVQGGASGTLTDAMVANFLCLRALDRA